MELYTTEEKIVIAEILKDKISQFETILKKLKVVNSDTSPKKEPVGELSRKFGPLSPEGEQERTKKICHTINSLGGRDINVSAIANSLALPRGTVQAWMQRRVSRPECPWKYGKGKTFFSLKTA